MAVIPDPFNSIEALIDRNHEEKAEPPRPHMGASQLGHHCDRWLWLSFRWAVIPRFSGRILRLFRRGHNEEFTIVDDLKAIGISIHSTGGAQSRVNFGCHVSGSIDGIIEHGVPEATKTKHIAEFKTHSLKSFNDLKKKGVKESKPMHHIQMNVYMYGMNINRALYLAVCKDDDRIYTERVRLDKAIAEKAIERGKRISLDNRLPPPISTDPTWYQCKLCDGFSFCHETKKTEYVNCRTCAHSTALSDSTWRCERHNANGIPVDFQRNGCPDHVLHPDLVPYEMVEGDDELQAVYIIEGKKVKNGNPKNQGVYSSAEILVNPSMCANSDEFIDQFRSMFDARIIK